MIVLKLQSRQSCKCRSCMPNNTILLGAPWCSKTDIKIVYIGLRPGEKLYEELITTGELKKSSDIDVLVSFDQGRKDLFNYMRLKMYLEELLGRKVDLVIKDAVKPRLRDRILSEVRYVQ